MDARGGAVWAPFPCMTPLPDFTLTSLHKSSADPGTGMCVLAHTCMGWARRHAHADLALGLFCSALRSSEPKWTALFVMCLAIEMLQTKSITGFNYYGII